jgi:hypothetical protein
MDPSPKIPRICWEVPIPSGKMPIEENLQLERKKPRK